MEVEFIHGKSIRRYRAVIIHPLAVLFKSERTVEESDVTVRVLLKGALTNVNIQNVGIPRTSDPLKKVHVTVLHL